MKVGRLVLRVAVGGLFVGHGTQKLFGWFGGSGLSATAERWEGSGLRPAKLHATAAGLAESGGGMGLALGYRTPLASAAVISVMLTAIKRVHFKNGLWSHKGGYEYNLVMIAAAMALAESGPGRLSLDALRGKQRQGARWGLLALALGAAGAAGANVLADRQSAKHAASVSAYASTEEPGQSADSSSQLTDPLVTPVEPQVEPAAESPVELAADDPAEVEPIGGAAGRTLEEDDQLLAGSEGDSDPDAES